MKRVEVVIIALPQLLEGKDKRVTVLHETSATGQRIFLPSVFIGM